MNGIQNSKSCLEIGHPHLVKRQKISLNKAYFLNMVFTVSQWNWPNKQNPVRFWEESARAPSRRYLPNHQTCAATHCGNPVWTRQQPKASLSNSAVIPTLNEVSVIRSCVAGAIVGRNKLLAVSFSFTESATVSFKCVVCILNFTIFNFIVAYNSIQINFIY